MTNAITLRWLYIASGAFIALFATGLYFDIPYFLLIPAALVVLWTAFFKLEHLLMFIVFFTPLSINLEEMEVAGVGMYLPTEPLLFGILLLFIFKLLTGKSIDKKIFRHPVSYVIYAYLAWMTLTCITSELPIVSLKFLLTRMWFIASFYFIATHVFSNPGKIRTYFLCYILPLMAVIIYTVTRHAQYGFDKDSSHWVMEPLFKDHTSYGAVLAMFFPVLIGMLMTRKMNLLLRVILAICFIILTTGLVLSYTRAAWISILGAAGILSMLLLKVKLRTLLAAIVMIAAFLAIGWEDISISLQQNKQESSDKLDEHVSSISNVSSDASNLERLNRWNCAYEMFKERPVVGWGPGTYQFVYAPFQRSKDRTIISTNQGDGGNAHSEYLGPLSEQGFPGTILVLVLLYTISSLSFRLFYQLDDFHLKTIVASVYLGLMTYFIHGVLNNYLDTDKASIPFWGFMAILVAIDIYHTKKPEQKEQHAEHISS
ncbi:MAG: O-antigen ligase family protein [Flavobacteriales bacterium]|nr:O-antigen ligase family protein [Flavobacteriales bacterium]